jgi:hypothetical protein
MPEEEILQQKDPNALPENFFEQEEEQDQEAFKESFGFNASAQERIINSEDVGHKKTTDDDDDDPFSVDDDLAFKFDESLAETEKAELEELNSRLGTNFKDLNELKATLNNVDNKEDLSQIEESRQLVKYFGQVLNYDSETIVREDFEMKAQQAGKNIKDPDFVDELEMKISRMKDNEVLDYASDSLKAQVRAELANQKAIVEEFDTKQNQTQQQKETAFKTKIQEGVNDLFKEGTYLGIKVERNDLLEIYGDISKNKHIEHLKANPLDAVKFAFFKKHEKVIMDTMKKPTYQDGVQKTLKEMGMQTSGKSSKTVSNDQTGNREDLSFLQRFTQA